MVTACALSVVTLAFIAVLSLRFAILAPQLDVALNTTGAVIAMAVATLGYVRFREEGGFGSLLAASAFLVLATASFVSTAAAITGADVQLGLTVGNPGQLPLYFWAAARLLSAGLLAAGAVSRSARRIEAVGHPRAVFWLPTILLAFACTLLWLVRDRLPVLVNAATLHQLADEASLSVPLPGINPGILLLDGIAAVLLVFAVVGYARGVGPSLGMPRSYLVVGLVFAVFSEIHYILYPAGVYSGPVSTGDALRVAFYLVLFAGIQAGTRADLQRLRTAYARLRLLAASEADRTAIAERARLARELHDGLAQDLWTTKLEFDRLVGSVGPHDGSIEEQLGRVGRSLNAALLEARDSVAALRSGFDAGLSFADELPRRLDAFADSTGYPVDLDQDARAARLPGVFAADALRIVDEALHNVQKHADATRIRVRVTVRDETLIVSVDDNGRGFNPSAPHPGHGLIGMHERAAMLGGHLEIRSAPGDGTSVQLHLPVATVIE
ncbi:MAG: ATP-binding protein [Candidatus Limnocylindrales bacterium]